MEESTFMAWIVSSYEELSNILYTVDNILNSGHDGMPHDVALCRVLNRKIVANLH